MGFFTSKEHERRFRENMEKMEGDPKTKRITNVIAGLILVVIFYGCWQVVSSIFAPDKPAEIANKQAKTERSAQEELRQQASRARLLAISGVEMAIKSNLRDPNSLEFEKKAWNLDNDAMCFIYRAKNGFGGVNKAVLAVVGGTPYETAAAYRKYCPEAANYENYTF